MRALSASARDVNWLEDIEKELKRIDMLPRYHFAGSFVAQAIQQ